MLVLRRSEGQWVEITHKSGDKIRLRVYNIRFRPFGQLDVAFDDEARNFNVERPERVTRKEAAAAKEDAGDAAPLEFQERPADQAARSVPVTPWEASSMNPAIVPTT